MAIRITRIQTTGTRGIKIQAMGIQALLTRPMRNLTRRRCTSDRLRRAHGATTRITRTHVPPTATTDQAGLLTESLSASGRGRTGATAGVADGVVAIMATRAAGMVAATTVAVSPSARAPAVDMETVMAVAADTHFAAYAHWVAVAVPSTEDDPLAEVVVPSAVDARSAAAVMLSVAGVMALAAVDTPFAAEAIASMVAEEAMAADKNDQRHKPLRRPMLLCHRPFVFPGADCECGRPRPSVRLRR